eukprot:Gb_37966 [translate_table: standard]
MNTDGKGYRCFLSKPPGIHAHRAKQSDEELKIVPQQYACSTTMWKVFLASLVSGITFIISSLMIYARV